MSRHLDSHILGRLLGLTLVVVLLTLAGSLWKSAHAEQPSAPSGTEIWVDVPKTSFLPRGERLIVPDRYRTLALNEPALQALLATAPLESDQSARSSPVILELPLPDGTFGRFQIVESPIMAPKLAAEFPSIKTYAGQGLDDQTATVRFDWTPQGFHAMILSAGGSVFIDPYSRNDTTHYISYYRADYRRPGGTGFTEYPPLDPGGRMQQEIARLIANRPAAASGAQLRTYRLANAATGEYTAFHGGTVPLAMAAIVTTINRVDGIYETEVAIRLILVANNSSIVYTNAATDPYTNYDAFALLTQNQANLDAVIGDLNYDIGHVFSTGGGGLAALGVPCQTGLKAQGETGSSNPVGDPFDVDYVAHEIGHQFGGNHTFNGNGGACGGNRNASTAYEPGSGSTIMAYAGICGAQDLQPNSDPFFHTVSFDEIGAYITSGAGSACPAVTNTGNNPPVPNVGTGGFTIPANTPFALTGSATDADADPLTYLWEEFDLGTAGAPGNSTNPPFFRSWPESTSPTRTFPRLSNLVNNTLPIGEVLPNITRSLNFRLTARDNRIGGGGVDYLLLTFNVTTAAGPFQVTAPNTAVSWAGFSTQTITWNVANTTDAPVSCANVDISLSTDGGLTYPTIIVLGTPNDGAQAVPVPNIPTTTARIKVACSNNVFFDISDVSFTINNAAAPSEAYADPAMACASNTPCYPTVQQALDATANDGRVRVYGTHNISSPLQSAAGGAQNVNVVGSGGTLNRTGPAGALFTIGDGNVTLKGLSLTNAPTVFNQVGAGALTAYANNISSFTTAYTGAGAPNIGHNFWGTNDPTAPAPAGMPPAEWGKRLGAPLTAWADGSPTATMGGASLTGGTGTAVIVSTGRAATPAAAPFGNGVAGHVDQTCSEFYDFFTIDGGGTWTVSVPVDDNASCNTTTRDQKRIFWIPPGTLAQCTPADSTTCWDLISSSVSINGQNLEVANVTVADLGATPFVAGNPTGGSPTALRLDRLAAQTDGAAILWPVSVVSGLVGLTLFVRRRRSQASE